MATSSDPNERGRGGLVRFGDAFQRWSQQHKDEHGVPDTSEELAPVCPDCGGSGWVSQAPGAGVGDKGFGLARICHCLAGELRASRQARLSRYSALSRPHVAAMLLKTFKPRTPMQRRAWLAARQYAADPRGWFILTGPVGLGKTHLAAGIGHDLEAKQYGVLFAVVPDLLDYLRDTFDPDSPVSYDALFDYVRNAPALILDDLGAQKMTPWAEEKLYQIINYRYNAMSPMVLTLNGTFDALYRQFSRIGSRLGDVRFSQVWDLDGEDHRLGNFA